MEFTILLLDPLQGSSLQVEILSVCPSSLLIIFLIQTLSSRNLQCPSSMSPMPASQLVPLPNQLVPLPSQLVPQ